MFCTKCGAKLPDNAKFCPKCGNPCTIKKQFSEQVNQTFQSTERKMESEIHNVKQSFSSNNQMPAGRKERLQDDRSLAIYILLSIVTCGIYSYYFIYKMAHDVNSACEGDGEMTSGLAAFIILSFLTCGIYSFYWSYKIGNRLCTNAPRYGMTFPENGTTVLVWDLIGILLCGLGPFVAMHILIKNSNRICNAYNRQNNL